ncbi:MAG: type III pantothenate kinase [Candidatus Cloacimonetes bacterium]|nr:type III pantothenate kinase [Candidatus Cloacimonadota bacterium]
MEKNIFVIDIGNTNIVCGLYEGENLLGSWRIESDKTKIAEDYYVLFTEMLSSIFDNNHADSQNFSLLKLTRDNILCEHIDYFSISSVVPVIGKKIEEMLDKYFLKPYIFVDGKTKLGIKYLVDDPSCIGADLIANAYAAWHKYQTNCIIIDFGTATTIQMMGADGTFYGTSILPGIVTATNGLLDKAAQLSREIFDITSYFEMDNDKEQTIDISPTIPLKIKEESKNNPILGKNTKESLISGIIMGHCLSVEGFINIIKEEYIELQNIQTIITGGIADMMKKQSKMIDICDKNLTLEGLFLIAKKILVT